MGILTIGFILGGTNTEKFLIIMTDLDSKVYFLLSFCHFVLI